MAKALLAFILIVALVVGPFAMQKPEFFTKILPGGGGIFYQFTITSDNVGVMTVLEDTTDISYQFTYDPVNSIYQATLSPSASIHSFTIPTSIFNATTGWRLALNGRNGLWYGDCSQASRLNVSSVTPNHYADWLYGIENNTYSNSPSWHTLTNGYVMNVTINGNWTTFYVDLRSSPVNPAVYVNYIPISVDVALATTAGGDPFYGYVFLDSILRYTPQTVSVDVQNNLNIGDPLYFTVSAPLTLAIGSRRYAFNAWSDAGAATHVVDLTTAIYTLTAVGPLTAEYTVVDACSSLAPTLLGQLENGCIIPAIVNTYAYVIGVEWLFGIIAALISGMIYLKSENTWLVLIVNVVLMPICAFLLPSQLSGLIYDIFILAIAGTVYLLIRG